MNNRLYGLLCLAFSLTSLSAFSQHSCSHGSDCGIEPIYEDVFSRVGPPHGFAPYQSRSLTINVNYNGFTPAAQAAFQYAVDIWASLLTSTVPVQVDATFENLGGGALGAAGANNFFSDFPGSILPNTYYPSPLADKLRGFDMDPGQPDIVATFNNTTNWYYGTDGNTPSGQFDFVTVVLHELGHGLGVQGSGVVNGSAGEYGLDFFGTPVKYDHFMELGNGTDILSLTNGSTTLGNALTSNDIYWNGGSAIDNNNGVRPRMYAPTSFNQGSSYSHLNENTYPAGNTNSLMTPFVGQAEANHNPGPIILGLMEDIGWTLDNGGGSGNCTPNGITLYDSGCADDGYGNILPVIGMTFDIDGPCQVIDICWGVNGATPSCVDITTIPLDVFDGDSIVLTGADINSTYEIYYTTEDGQSASAFFTTGDCSSEIPGCTDPLATNYNAAATVDDGSCIYDNTICDCMGTEHSIGVLGWLGDGYADDGSFAWDGQPVFFDCETWGWDCGDIAGSPSTDPFNVCGGNLPPNNGCGSTGGCTADGLTLFDAGCADDGYGNILPIIGIVFDINGPCQVIDVCFGIDGAAPACTDLTTIPIDAFDTDTIYLFDSDINATYEFYFTTVDGQSPSAFFTTGDCSNEIPGCTDPNAVNYNAAATIDDGSCIYDTTICDCEGTEHTIGVLDWLGDGYADDGSFAWDGQPVFFDCETWGWDCGDIAGSPSTDPFNVCGGNLPPNNGCGTAGNCVPNGLTLYDSGCADDGYGNILPVIGMVFDIDGPCQVIDVCWGVNGATPACVDITTIPLDAFDGDTLVLTGAEINSNYEIYFTTEDGTSSSAFFTTGDCATGTDGCTDPNACNYNPSATNDDGSCEYVSCAGCTDSNACNYDSNATIDDGSCEYISCAGCTDPTACNYDPTATIDDGSCDFGDCQGCTDPMACNFDENASVDDGSCEYESCAGCTDPAATNYDPNATLDDGSCEYDCVFPIIEYVPYCEDGVSDLFMIDMEIDELGNGAPYTVTNNQSSDAYDLNFIGSITLGPFEVGDQVVVTVSSTTLAGCLVTSPVITYDCVSSVNNIDEIGFNMYPNPVDNALHIVFDAEKASEIRLIDALGKSVMLTNSSAQATTLDVSNLSPGVYQLMVIQEGVSAIRPFVKF